MDIAQLWYAAYDMHHIYEITNGSLRTCPYVSNVFRKGISGPLRSIEYWRTVDIQIYRVVGCSCPRDVRGKLLLPDSQNHFVTSRLVTNFLL